MTKKLKEYIPDEPREISFIGSSINRLGTALAAISIIQESVVWSLVCVLLIWAGYEVEKYFQMYIKDQKKPE